MAEAQRDMPVHETLEERLAEAETQEEHSEIVRTWTQKKSTTNEILTMRGFTLCLGDSARGGHRSVVA